MYPQKKRILCVDDDGDTRYLLKILLDRSDLETVCVGNVAAALRLMGTEQFRLYVIDGQLPGVSGLTMCEEIRRRDRQTPIVIFSGQAYADDREAGLRAGANVYIVKPDTGQLVPAVRRLLEEAEAAAMSR
ncbi:MAG TPA: response regulator [Pyrinomonadaceae bacterium]